MNNICTTVEQSIKLERLGLPIRTADMFYNEEPDEEYKDMVDTETPMVIKKGQEYHLEEYGVPAWSLTALLKLMPDFKPKGSDWPVCLEMIKSNQIYHFHYMIRPGTVATVVHATTSSDIIEAAYNMIVWLLENGYIKKGSHI